jgi:hypothetical protein
MPHKNFYVQQFLYKQRGNKKVLNYQVENINNNNVVVWGLLYSAIN